MARQPIFEEPSRQWWIRPSPILALAVAMAVILQVQFSLPRARADSTRVLLQDVQFSPPHLDVSVGDTVVWEAKDDRHTVTARNGEFDSGRSGLMSDGDEFRRRFTKAGTYPYFCRVRQDEGMQGEVVVFESPADRAAASSSTTSTTLPIPAGVVTTAPSSTTTTTTTTSPSTTTTSRPLATSSTVNLATTTTGPVTVPVTPHEPPRVDPNVETAAPPEANLPGTPAALRRHRGAGPSSGLGLTGLIVVLPAAAVGTFVVSRRLRRRRGSA